ncbi:protein kinase domain-containing protein [Streptomyces boninensis]|uniref:protein kinase domain-containing protein n=1 Tax=Streptomyces boninensis TaxID=2039455 RepID=UPI003B22577E
MPEDGERSGELVDGRYELIEPLGAGGMGEVWRARDTRLGREVAVKVFAPPPGTDEADRAEMLARFDREARAVAALESPHVVALHDHGTAEIGGRDGTAYLVMALVRGRTLERVLKDDGRVPYEKALVWVEQICRALATAHAAGVVHRDIKPANVMVTGDDSVKVLDFGIARFLEGSSDQRLTRTGALPFGSVLYMAPERFRDDAGGARTDLYAVGCVLYELLVGRPPYVGTSAQVMYNHLNDTPLRPSRAVRGLPGAVDRVVLALMARDPEGRPADAETAAEAIREAGLPAAGREAGPPGAERAVGPPAAGRKPAVPDPDASAPTSTPAQPQQPSPRRAATPKPPSAAASRTPRPNGAVPPTPKPRPKPALTPATLTRAARQVLISLLGAALFLGGGVTIALMSSDRGPTPHDPPVKAVTPSPAADGYSVGALSGRDDTVEPTKLIIPRAVQRAAQGNAAAPGVGVTPVMSDEEPVQWTADTPGLIGVVGDDPTIPSSYDERGPLPTVFLRTCRKDDPYIAPDQPDTKTNASVFSTSAAATDMGRAMARHLAGRPGVHKVYVRGDSEKPSTRTLIDELRAAGADVRVDHAGTLGGEAASVLREGIREYRPDAVYLQTEDAKALTAWMKAVDGSGFRGIRAAWDPTSPECSGRFSEAAAFDFPDGWLAPRGYYSAARDSDRTRAAKVRAALGKDLAALPYAAEQYDATRALLAAWSRVPKETKDAHQPTHIRARLTQELPSATPKGLLTGGWKQLKEAEQHPPVWIDRHEDSGWRQVARTKG